MTPESDRDDWSPRGPVSELSSAHAWALLESVSVGRLALSEDDRPQIFPVYFASDGTSIIFRTAEGTKLHALLNNAHVAFEADTVTETESWSVVVRGLATVLHDNDDIRAADALAFPRWVPTASYVYVRVTPADIRGRHFTQRVHAEREV